MVDEEKPDLEALLEHYGSRTKPGRNTYMTSCPLHEDRTPSLSVRIDYALWNCHSCGESGDSYTLIQKKEDTDFTGSRAFASALNLSTGGTGGGDRELRGSSYAGGRKVPSGEGDRPKRSKYVPRGFRP